ncbi:hypothetical protein [Chryseobacterium sp. M5A1_1a]
MNKIIKWILIVSVGCILLYLVANFAAVFMLTYFNSSKRIENTGEQRIFEKIKKDYSIENIERTPEYERQIKNKDTATYTLYLYSKSNCDIENDSLKKNSLNIVKEINSIHLDSKYYKYRLVFCCQSYNPNGAAIQYLRKDLTP